MPWRDMSPRPGRQSPARLVSSCRRSFRTDQDRLSTDGRLGFFGCSRQLPSPATVRLLEDVGSMIFKIPTLLLAKPSDVPRQCNTPTLENGFIQLFRDQQVAKIRKGDVSPVKEVFDMR